MRSYNSDDAVLAYAVNEGKQNDIIIKVQRSHALTAGHKGGNQNDMSLKLPKSDALNRGVHGGKQNDIILKFQK